MKVIIKSGAREGCGGRSCTFSISLSFVIYTPMSSKIIGTFDLNSVNSKFDINLISS